MHNLATLPVGTAFTFDPDGLVYVRCRGGFRLGRGSKLYYIQPGTQVYTL